MKWYIGNPNGYHVTIHNGDKHYDLNPQYDMVNHSPDGFCWGYNGSGPSQLAFAICMDVLNDKNKALKNYFKFRTKVVAELNQTGSFRISENAVRKYINETD